MDNQSLPNTWYWVAAILGILLVQYVVSMAQQIAPIPYSQFQELLRAGKVAEIGISDRFIQGTLKEPLPGSQTRSPRPASTRTSRRNCSNTGSSTRARSRARCCGTSCRG